MALRVADDLGVRLDDPSLGKDDLIAAHQTAQALPHSESRARNDDAWLIYGEEIREGLRVHPASEGPMP